MQSIAISHHQQSHSGLQVSGVAKLVISALLLLVAVVVYELSVPHLIMLALVSGLVLALFYRIENMSSIGANNAIHTMNRAGMDGGSFHHQAGRVKAGSGSVIADGGSFERATSKFKS